jgi:DNA-directed DNA polymerase III PolC
VTDFVHLHLHGCTSFCEGAAPAEDYLRLAAADGQPALALTDTNGLTGFVPFFDAAEAAGVRPILGACVREPGRPGEWEGGGARAVLLVEDRRGYGNLCRILSRRHLMPEEFHLEDSLLRWGEGLVALTSDEDLLRALAPERPAGSLYVELRLAPEPRPRALARELGLPVVATGAVFFPRARDRPIHRVLTAIGRNLLVRDVPEAALAPREACFAGREEMAERFGDCPEALRATVTIAERCRFAVPRPGPLFPEFPVPAGETPYSLLTKLCFEGVARRYRPLRPEVLARLGHELSVILDLGFAGYFLIVHDILRFALSEGIPMAGRGSAADSLVAYCLGLTIVDPVGFDLTFERFLNPARSDPPDIDLDICWKGRDRVLDYVFETYGRERTAMISTVNTFQGRSAVREVAKTAGLSEAEVSRVSKRLPHDGAGSMLAAARALPECRGLPFDREPWRTVFRVADRIAGFPRHLAVHPGGIVIAPTEIVDFAPVERSAKGLVITQYDKDPVQALGLVKIDLLGQRGLSALAGTVAAVRENHGVALDLEGVPMEDERTGVLLAEARTLGCFQIESPGTRNLLRMLGARDQRDAMVALSLIRPGPSAGGMKDLYVLRKAGEEPVTYLDAKLEAVLSETFGVMLYQEDILKVAHSVAGFTLAEADELRRAISKQRSPERMERMHGSFLARAVAGGVAEPAAEAVWEAVSRFVGYSFSKAHAATYGRLAWLAAWLKARYPAEFMAAVLANEGGFYDARVYLEEARRLGVRILLPDVNRSGRTFEAKDGGIRIGLGRVRDLREETLDRIFAERAKGLFVSLKDFALRVPASEREVGNLVRAGAFDIFDLPRAALLWRVKALYARDGSPARRGERTLFGTGGELSLPSPDLEFPELPADPKERLVEAEFEVLGLSATAHPLEFFEERLREAGVVPARDLPGRVGHRVVAAGWLVTTRRVRTARGELMRFLTLEDRTGTLEAVLFPDTYRRFGHLLRGAGPYLLEGRMEDTHGAQTLTVEKLGTL